MKTTDLIDFRGGFFDSVPSELLKDNELLTAENCVWRNGITKRNGIDRYSTSDWSGFTGCKGGIRAYLNGAWTTIVALDDGSAVNFYAGATVTFTAINNDFDWQTGQNCEFAQLGDYVVVVNGYNKPAVIYYSSGLVVTTLEALDIRTRAEENWWAGQYDDDGAGTAIFIDDTIDAQDAGAADFQIVNTTNNDGCYVSCDYSFNKVIFKNCSQFAGTPVATYHYWNGTAWIAITPTTAPSWTAAAGDKTLEFDIPLNADGSLAWEPYIVDAIEGVAARYVLRLRFTTAPSGAGTADYLQVYHTQYLTQILFNEKPHTVRTHNNQIMMASGNSLNMSPLNQVTGWLDYQVDYFEEGGSRIMDMVSHQNTLVVFKEDTIYTLDTTNYSDPIRSKPLTSIGTTARRAAKQIGDFVAFPSQEGLCVFDGSSAYNVSKHIKTLWDSITTTNACAVAHKGEYWIAFPTNSIALVFDPDTFRKDEAGDSRVSLFKFTGYKVSQFIKQDQNTDTGFLIALVDQNIPYLAKCDVGTYDDLTGSATTAITMTLQTRYTSYASPMEKKYYGRIKIKIAQQASATTCTLTLYAEDGTASESVTISVAAGSGYHTEDITIPYTLDSKAIGIKIVNANTTGSRIIGFSFSTQGRGF